MIREEREEKIKKGNIQIANEEEKDTRKEKQERIPWVQEESLEGDINRTLAQ